MRRRDIRFRPKYREQRQRQLRRKLEKIAFDNYYQCAICGSHEDLEIHHLDYDIANFDDPHSYIIVCKKCHRKLEGKKRRKFRGG